MFEISAVNMEAESSVLSWQQITNQNVTTFQKTEIFLKLTEKHNTTTALPVIWRILAFSMYIQVRYSLFC